MVNSFGINLLYFLHFNKTLRVLFVCHCCKMATQQLERGKFLLKKKLLNSCCNQIFRVLTLVSGLTPFFLPEPIESKKRVFIKLRLCRWLLVKQFLSAKLFGKTFSSDDTYIYSNVFVGPTSVTVANQI